MNRSWHAEALCRGEDPKVFYPDPPQAGLAATRICQPCPAQVACLAWALEHDEQGVWGGTTAEQRRTMRRPAGSRMRRG